MTCHSAGVLLFLLLLALVCGCSQTPPAPTRPTADADAQSALEPADDGLPGSSATVPVAAATDIPESSQPAAIGDKPLGPAAAAKQEAAIKALEKLNVSVWQGIDIARLDGATDLSAAIKLIGELPSIEGVDIGKEMTDDTLAAVSRLPQINRLALCFNDKITGASLANLKQMPALKHLEMMYCEHVSPQDLQHLADCHGLESLRLSNIDLKGAGTQFLAPLKHLTKLDLEDCELTNRSLEPIAGLTRLEELSLNRNSEITDGGMAALAGLTHLHKLNLDGSRIGDAGLKQLAGLRELTDLNLSRTEITDSGMAVLAGYPRLQLLDIGNTAVTDAGFKPLAGLKELRELKVHDQAQITGTGCQYLANAPELTQINLSFTGLNDDGLAQIKKLKQLVYLDLPPYGLRSGFSGPFWRDLQSDRLTDAGMAHIGEMTQLDWLWISGGGVTDEGLMHLAGLTKLTSLGLGELPNVKGPGLTALAKMPDLKLLFLWDTGITDDGLKFAQSLKQLEALGLPRSATAAALDPVREMTWLKFVGVPATIDDAAIADLKTALPKVQVVKREVH